MPKPIIHIDATALRDSSCLLRFHRLVHGGYRSRHTTNDLVYGNSIHKYVEVMFKTGDKSKAAEALKVCWDEPNIFSKKHKQHLTVQHAFVVANMYWDYLLGEGFTLLKDRQGQPLSEHKFSIPYRETASAIYMLSGTMDWLATVRGGINFIGDIKTTSTYDHERYLEGYALDVQLKIYYLAVRIAALYRPDDFYAELLQRGFGAQIFAVFLNPDMSKIVFKRSRMFQFKEEDIAETQFCVDQTVERLDRWLEAGKEPPKEGTVNGACKTPYGSCSFFNICAASDEITRAVLMERQFKQQHYNPLMFR